MNKLLLSLITFVFFTEICFAQTGWFIEPSFTTQNIYDFKSSATYNLYAGSDNGKIFRSSNNGYNWTVYNFNDPLLNTSSFKYVYGESNDNFTSVGTGNAVAFKYETIDSVLRISVLPQTDLEAYTRLSGVFFYNSYSAAGAGGNFYIKDTANWRKDLTPTGLAAGRNINYCSRNIYVGNNGLIIKADSIGYIHAGGERIKWRIIPSGTTKNLYSVFASSGATMIAVGADGLILKSTDFGEHWASVPSPVTEDLYGVHLNYASLICGANGTILKYYQTEDKWFKQPTPTNEDLYSIYSLGYSDYISMGRNGIFLRTTDGGGSLKRFYGTSSIEGFYNPVTNSIISDTLKVTVRSSVSPYNAIATGKGKLNTGGYILLSLDPVVQNSVPYYIQINHRNSIETWSKTPLSFTSNDLSYNFCDSDTRAFGNNMKQVDSSPVWFGFYSGDFNQDGIVNLSDVIGVQNAAGTFTNGYVPSDMNGDNTTDISDVIITNNNSNNFVSVMRP